MPTLHQVRAEQCRRSFATFFRRGWHVLEPSTPLCDNWHIDALCGHVQAVLEDWRDVQRALMAGREPPAQRVQNLVVNIPPGTAKSRILSVYAPAWMWLEWPSWRAVFISGNPRVSIRDSMYCRELIRSDWYQGLFQPHWQPGEMERWTLTKDQDAKSLFRNTAGGLRMAIGAKSRITGDRYDCIAVDDPNDMATVHSEAERAAVNDWWDQGAGNRVNDLRHSTRFLIQQRGHESDLSGHVLPSGAWEHLVIPMSHQTQRACPCTSCGDYNRTGRSATGWSDPRTRPGELLDPNRFPAAILAQERTRLGETGYAGQYEQHPAPADGAIFRREWFANRYTRLPRLTDIATLWDTALKDKEQNDETACLTYGVGEADKNLYLLSLWHGRAETPDVADFLIRQADYFRECYGDQYRGDYVEDKVSGTTLMQYIRRMRPELAVIGVKAELDKVARAQGVTPICEAGRVLLPHGDIFPATQTWARDLLAQLLLFPNGAHDDMVDVFVYACMRFLGQLNRPKSRRGKAGGYAE